MRQPIYEFGEWFVQRLGTTVADSRVKAAEMGLTKDEARKAMRIAFQILGRQCGLSVRSLNLTLSKKETSEEVS